MTSPAPAPVAKCTKYTIHGGLPNGEIWETGFWTHDTGNGPGDFTAFSTQVLAVATKFQGHLQSQIAHMLSADSSILGLKAAYYNGATTPVYANSVSISGVTGTGTGNLPLQCCLVASLRTQLGGRRHRGRMYFPATGLVMNTHQANDGDCQDLVDSVRDMFADINSIGGSGDGPLVVVMSGTGQETTPVSSVAVDSRIDTQRRRAVRQAVRVVKFSTGTITGA